jgi:arsenate reductase (thioredoxin)
VSVDRKRVLFVCIGNSCRSQMAEAFARAYGSDVMYPASAGLAPATDIAPDTMEAMHAKALDLRDHFPKSLRHVSRAQFDLVVNMSGMTLPSEVTARIVDWDVPDPVLMDYEEHCEVRDLIERKVMQLVLEMRRQQSEPRFKGLGSGRLGE